MATFVHRAFDPSAAEYVYWRAEELDLEGAFYGGPPAFSTLENPVLIREIIVVKDRVYTYEPVTSGTLIEFDEVP